MTEAIADRLDTLAQRIRAELRQTAQVLGADLVGRVRQGPLDGGVLQARSGQLQASVQAEVHEHGDAVSVTLGATAPYARYHELGFHGTESVRASLRTITQAFGRQIPARAVAVRAHSRRIDYAGRPFLRPVFDAAAGDIRDAFAAAIERSIEA